MVCMGREDGYSMLLVWMGPERGYSQTVVRMCRSALILVCMGSDSGYSLILISIWPLKWLFPEFDIDGN